MADVNLLLGLSNVVLIWLTIYSAVLSLKWQFEDREKDAFKVEEKEQLVRDLIKKYVKSADELEKRIKEVETWLAAQK